jgi:hypothetical protein
MIEVETDKEIKNEVGETEINRWKFRLLQSSDNNKQSQNVKEYYKLFY